jgi:DNA polymerase III sliding clamp (beta) subunit (PCNA family)
LCRYTACPDQTAGALTGVRVEDDIILSCDRWRISFFNLDKESKLTATLPADLIDELGRFSKTLTQFAVKGNTIYFRMEKVIIGAQMLSGDYPSAKLLDAIKMTESTMELKLTKELKQKIAEASNRQNIIQEKVMEYDRLSKFTFEKNRVILFAQNDTVGKIEEQIECPGSAAVVFSFFVNPVFLLKMFEETDQLTYSAEHSVASFLGPQFVHMVKTKAPAQA